MKVRIGANSHMDVPHLWCAGRAFPTKGLREVEVLDQEEDPPMVVSVRPNPTTGVPMEIPLANQDVMGRKSYAAIIADGKFSVIETVGLDAEITRNQVGAAREEATRLAGLHSDAQVQIAGLTATVADLQGKLEAEQLRVMELEEQVAKLTAPAPAAVAPTAVAATAVPAAEVTPAPGATKARAKTEEKAEAKA